MHFKPAIDELVVSLSKNILRFCEFPSFSVSVSLFIGWPGQFLNTLVEL